MLTLKDNIRSVLDCNFAETKDEIKEVALNAILELIENDRKNENSSEKPNNCETCGTPRHLCKYCIEEDRMWTPKEVCDRAQKDCKNCWKELHCRAKDEPQADCCETCKHKDDGWDSEACDPCSRANNNYEPQYHADIECNYKDCENCEHQSYCPQREDEPRTGDKCNGCIHLVFDGYWYCECHECNYEPKTEPQADNLIEQADEMIKFDKELLQMDEEQMDDGTAFIKRHELRVDYGDEVPYDLKPFIDW